MKRLILSLACLCGVTGCQADSNPPAESGPGNVDRVTYKCSFDNCKKGTKSVPAHAGVPSC